MSKDIAVKVSIDVGENLTKIMEQLANAIGTTTEKVFPWLVKQHVIAGYVESVMALAFLITCAFTMRYALKVAEKDDDYIPGVLATGVVMLIGVAIIMVSASTIAGNIFNPEYGATMEILNTLRQK